MAWLVWVLLLASGSKKVNMNTPIDTIIPTIIFDDASFNAFSLTRVHRMATSSTEMRLHALNAITTGKLVLAAAQVYVIVDIKTMKAQMNEFFWGMSTVWGRVRLYNLPINAVMAVGTNTSIALSSSIYI